MLNRSTYATNIDKAIARSYYRGDTWQYWIGPLPLGSTHADSISRDAIARVYQRSNKVKECVDRLVNALVGKLPHWAIDTARSPQGTTEVAGDGAVSDGGERESGEGPTLVDRLNADLGQWVTANNRVAMTVNGVEAPPLWEATRDLLVEGRGYLRLWMPARLSDNAGLARVLMSRVDSDAISVEHDDDGFPIAYIVNTAMGAERHERDGNGVLTVTTREGTVSYPQLGAGWLIAELKGPSSLSQDIFDAQNLVNLARTMESLSLISNGAVERILTNTQLPGSWTPDPTAPGGVKFVASPDGLALGPGKTAFITGLPIYNEVGATAGYTTPGISYSQPSDLANFHNSIAAATESIYQAFGQGHLLAVESDLAGISREILRHDADLKRQTYERTVVAALEQLLTTLLKLQGYDYPVTVELQNASGYVSPEIKTQIMAEYDRGLLSKATTMAKLGTIEDPDAELALIDQESSTTQLVAKSAMDSAFGAFVDGEPEPDEVGKGEKVSAK